MKEWVGKLTVNKVRSKVVCLTVLNRLFRFGRVVMGLGAVLGDAAIQESSGSSREAGKVRSKQSIPSTVVRELPSDQSYQLF